MSDNLLKVAVITPEGAAFEGEATTVVVPAFDGEVAFLHNHAPFVGALGAGELRVIPESGDGQHFFLQGGVVRVADNEIAILAEQVESLDALDVEAEQRRLAEVLGTPVIGSLEALDAKQLAVDAARARRRLADRRAGNSNS
ncbi:MAG: F0F1 ATP synthase subunit epsilon [Planctomycetota bacterium]|nr:F0F1 ATP synthase subunit epsilon [Planctomycetota bacterium]